MPESQSNALIKYDAACTALAEANAVDEVLEIRNQAEAMKAYARQAKNADLMRHAKEITLRAERKLGEMLLKQKEEFGLNKGEKGRFKSSSTGGSKSEPPVISPTLADMGIDKKLSARAQKLAAHTPEAFEQAVQDHKDGIAAANAKLVNALASPVATTKVKPEPVAEPTEPTEPPAPSALEMAQDKIDELAYLLESQQADIISMSKIVEASEPLQAAEAEIKRLNEKVRVLNERINGLMNEKNEAIKAAKSWQNRCIGIEKQLKAARSADNV